MSGDSAVPNGWKASIGKACFRIRTGKAATAELTTGFRPGQQTQRGQPLWQVPSWFSPGHDSSHESAAAELGCPWKAWKFPACARTIREKSEAKERVMELIIDLSPVVFKSKENVKGLPAPRKCYPFPRDTKVTDQAESCDSFSGAWNPGSGPFRVQGSLCGSRWPRGN